MTRFHGFSGTLILAASGFLGLWLVAIKGLGPHWSLLPGGSVDSGLNIYLLEHFYRWLSGSDRSFWTAGFFYPFPETIAFGDNFLGSGPVYAALRLAGLDRESAFQGWYVVGYALNFAAAAWVLTRMHSGPLGAGAGAFFFAFGLPMLAQENHVQLLYRCGVPLACYCLWDFINRPRFGALGAAISWAVWQFYLSIYTGVFLAMLLGALILFAPLCAGADSASRALRFWPQRARAAWRGAGPVERILASFAVILAAAMLGLLIRPYWDVTRRYHFGWGWDYVASMLPTWRSYLIADRAQLWRPLSSLIADFPNRVEHQLFPGVAAVSLQAIGVVGLIRPGETQTRRVVGLHAAAGLSLVVLTMLVSGLSMWHILWSLPGIDSLRAPARIVLIGMWPAAVLIAYSSDLLVGSPGRLRLGRIGLVAILSALLVVESVLFDHYAYSKQSVSTTLSRLRAQVPAVVPHQPILVLDTPAGGPGGYTEVDAMLLAQDLGWPAMNGYAGNFPPGYGLTTENCLSVPNRILRYMDFAGIQSPAFYLGMIRRTVPLGFTDCDPAWWQTVPR